MRSRPTGVLVIAIYYLVCGAAAIASALWLMMLSADTSRVPFGGAQLAKYPLLIAVVTAAIGAGYVATCWGLSQLRQWAQAAAITVAGLSLLLDATTVVFLSVGGGSVPVQPYLIVAVSATVSIGIIRYLLSADVTSVFDVSAAKSADTRCPHCFQSGIRPGMTVCPYCKQSLFALTQHDFIPTPPRPTPLRPTRVDVPHPAALGWLVVKAGPDTGRRVDLIDDNAIGRDARCQITLTDDHVSRQHARVKLEAGQFFIYDVGSSGGTFVNGRPVQRLMLYDGAVIRLGNTTMEFKKTA